MADGFVEEDLCPLDSERTLLVLEWDELSALGTRDCFGELLILLLAKCFDGAFGHTPSCGGRDLLHGLEVELCIRPGLLDGTTGSNFSPVNSELLDLAELFVSQLGWRHDQSE